MIAEKWKPVFGNDHAQTKRGVPMTHIDRHGR
jgi:hypothetical protein